MRIFAHSTYHDPWWDYMHNGYISAAPGSGKRGFTPKGVNPEVNGAEPLDDFKEPTEGRTRVSVTATGPVIDLDDPTVPRLVKRAMIDPTGTADSVVTDREARIIQGWYRRGGVPGVHVAFSDPGPL